MAHDRHAIHFRCAQPPTPDPGKYAQELLDAYLFVEDADALSAEYAARSLEFVRQPADMPWQTREFGIKDRDRRLLAFGSGIQGIPLARPRSYRPPRTARTQTTGPAIAHRS